MSDTARIRTANFFGILGYLSCGLQWLWLVVVFMPLLLDSGLKELLTYHPSAAPAPVVPSPEPSPFLMVIAVIIAAVVLVGTVVVLLRLPLSVARIGKKVTQTVAQAALPIVTHHQVLPEKKRRQLTARIIKLFKLLLCLLPVILLAITTFTPQRFLPIEAIWFIGAVLSVGSLVWFSLQYLLARLLRVPAKSLL